MQVNQLSTDLDSCSGDFLRVESASFDLRYFVAKQTYMANGVVSATKTMGDPWGANLARMPAPRNAHSRAR